MGIFEENLRSSESWSPSTRGGLTTPGERAEREREGEGERGRGEREREREGGEED